MFRRFSLCSAIALAVALGLPAPVAALSLKTCSDKYREAREADALKGMKWNEFRKAKCADGNASGAEAAAAEREAAKPADPASTTPAAKTAPKTAPAPKTAGASAAFPGAVSAKYSGETPAKARMRTCLDQYRANRESGASQPKWIEKGGGYYSQCNAKLKTGA